MTTPPDQLSEEVIMLLAIAAGCKIEMNFNPERQSFVVTTANPIGVQLINGRYVVREYVGVRKK